jgi:hypothetical protein
MWVRKNRRRERNEIRKNWKLGAVKSTQASIDNGKKRERDCSFDRIEKKSLRLDCLR